MLPNFINWPMFPSKKSCWYSLSVLRILLEERYALNVIDINVEKSYLSGMNTASEFFEL